MVFSIRSIRRVIALSAMALACPAGKDGSPSTTDATTQPATTSGETMASTSTTENPTTTDSGPDPTSTVSGTTGDEPNETCVAYAEHLVTCAPDESEFEDEYLAQCITDLKNAMETSGPMCAAALEAFLACLAAQPCEPPSSDCNDELNKFEATCDPF